MPRHRKNSEWQRRTSELGTDRGQVDEAVENEDAFEELMVKYRDAVSGYLEYLLNREQFPPDEASATITLVWEDIQRAMVGKLASEWASGRHSFRDLLLEATHKALHDWFRPQMRRLMVTEPDRKERVIWAQQMRPVILRMAWDRLEAYQGEHRNQYHAILRLRENHPDESIDTLNAMLPSRPGGQRQDPTGFRKGLERARDLFGRYLCDEIEAGYPMGVIMGLEQLRQGFIELELMEYAEESKYCRWRMKLGGYPEGSAIRC